MKKFIVEKGVIAPLDRSNVDTDAIIPKQFLKSIKRSGFGVNLFDEWRYEDEGYVGQLQSERKPNASFVLNNPLYQDASVLLARENFGCGSSREHAVWALDDYGFRAVIASSFADIFYNNCFKNGLLPIALKEDEVDLLFSHTDGLQKEVVIDLEKQTVFLDDLSFSFDVDPFRKHCLLNGLDSIALTLEHRDKIEQFEKNYKEDCPWIFQTP